VAQRALRGTQPALVVCQLRGAREEQLLRQGLVLQRVLVQGALWCSAVQ
jgi:hypothetical protein